MVNTSSLRVALLGLALAAAAPAQEALLPDEESPGFWKELGDAAVSGRAHLDLRLRYEYADQEGLEHSNAWTERLRLGYGTRPLHGVSAYAELEDVRALRDDLYNAAGLNGEPQRTVIADPEDTELNQLYLRAERSQWSSHAVLGRQRIILDDHRFIGNVGWRQNEQTYDGVLVESAALEGVTATYAYLTEVNRVFGPDANRDFDSDSHAFHVAWELPGDLGRLVGFAYLLRFSNAATQGSDSFGARLSGRRALEEDFFLDYELSWAYQQEGRSSPLDYRAPYSLLSIAGGRQGWGRRGAARQALGRDPRHLAFSTPLATLHKFNGWADVFLTTPAAGLEDWYGFLDVELPAEFKATAVFHWFTKQRGHGVLGQETDLLLSRSLTENVDALLKFAYFNGSPSEGFADLVRAWAEVTFRF